MDALELVLPWILKIAIDNIEKSPQKAALLTLSFLLIGIAAVQGIFRFLMRKFLIGISRKIEYSLRIDFFRHLQKLDSIFFSNARTGSIMAIMSNDLEAVRNFLGPGVLNLFNTIFVFVTTLIVMFLIDVKLSLYSLVAIPILPLLVSRLSAQLHKRFKVSQEQYALLSAKTQESIAGIKVIKSFSQEINEKKIFSDLNIGYVNKNLSLAKVRSFFWPAMIFVGGIGSLVVLIAGGREVISGRLTMGQFVQFSAYIGSITWPLISLGWVINLIRRGAVSMGRINNIFKIKPEIVDSEYIQDLQKIHGSKTASQIKSIKGDIRFEKVFFRYELNEKTKELIRANFTDFKDSFTDAENPEWILSNINFEILSGMRVGIVGFTGSGKSTLINLIPRLYQPQKGKIFIDDREIRSLPIELLRSHIGTVTQEPFLFSKTIRENIIFGGEEYYKHLNRNELEEQILNVSRISHLHEEIISFPKKYDTAIGERGVTLSGGQKQRLAIARALFIKPSILILDDSFSSVDTNTEELILKELQENIAGVTTIMISHRISTIKDSDVIIVLDEGRIDRMGKHDELIKDCGIYRGLYLKQQLSEELKEEL